MHHGHHRFAHHGCDSLHFELEHRTRAFGIGDVFGGIADAAKEVVGVGKGVVEGAVDTVKGIAEVVTHPVDAARGIASLVTHPTESWPALWHGITNPIVEDWQHGNEGEAVGRVIWGVAEVILGSKGAAKIGKAGSITSHIDEVADVSKVGTAGEVASKVDEVAEVGTAGKVGKVAETAAVADARTGEALTRLEEAGVKLSRPDVVWADRVPADGVIKTKADAVFLETGNPKAGLKHILDGNPEAGTVGHADDFARRGVPREQVPDLIREAVDKGTATATKKSGTYDIAVNFNGVDHNLRVAIGNNGFIVSAFPI